MSFFGRLLGRQAPAPPSPPNSVVIPDDVAARLAEAGSSLDDAVAGALRTHLAALDAAASRPPPAEGERLPFWLTREEGDPAEIDDALRDRLERRRAAEAEEAAADGDARRPRRRAGAPPADPEPS